MTQDSCTNAGCLWDDTTSIEKAPSCFLPDSSQYGYEVNANYKRKLIIVFIVDVVVVLIVKVNGAVVNLPSNTGFRVDLRRRRLAGGSLPPSLYGGDIDEVVFEVNYHSDYSMGFSVNISFKIKTKCRKI